MPGPQRLWLVPALLAASLVLSGCSSGIGERIRSWLPGRSAQATEPAPPRPAATLPPGDVSGRVARLESGVAQLQREFNELRPTIQRLVAVEADLDELVVQLFTVVTRDSPSVAAAPAAAAPTAPPPATAPRPAAGAAPLALLPNQAACAPAAAAPTAPPAVAAPALAPAIPAGSYALHLASYRQPEKAVEGWEDLTGKVPRALEGLRPGMSTFDKAGDGRYYRLNAGPVASRADAESRCRTIQNSGLYCAVLPYAGTAPL